MVDGLEPAIDRYMDRVDLPPKFVIPGGTELSAASSTSPAAAIRRAERRVAALPRRRRPRLRGVLAYLNRAADLVYAMARFTDVANPRCSRAGGQSTMRSAVARRRKGHLHDVEIDGHRLVVDEPTEAGRHRRRPPPTRLLAASLASCTAITIGMYADRKGWDMGELEVAVDFDGPPKGAATLRLQDPDPGRARRRAARADPDDRRQVPGPPDAQRAGGRDRRHSS